MQKLLKENPKLSLLSKTKLYSIAREHDITKKEVDAYFESKEIYQIYKPRTKKTKLVITAPPYSFQIDIIILPKYKHSNNGVTRFLLLVDILSRKAYAYILKTGKMDEVIDKYLDFIKNVEEPLNSIAGDDFFNNKKFIEVNKELMINLYTDVSKDDHLVRGSDKLGILDRCVRTLKKLIEKYMLTNKTTRWTSFLDKIIDLYNDTPNNGIKNKTPNEVFDDHDYMMGLYENQSKKNRKTFKKVDINVGDTVRIARGKTKFDKETYTFSTELYKVKMIDGYRFVLVDENGDEVKRKYKADELLKVIKTTERVDKETIGKADKKHKHKLKLRREFGEDI